MIGFCLFVFTYWNRRFDRKLKSQKYNHSGRSYTNWTDRLYFNILRGYCYNHHLLNRIRQVKMLMLITYFRFYLQILFLKNLVCIVNVYLKLGCLFLIHLKISFLFITSFISFIISTVNIIYFYFYSSLVDNYSYEYKLNANSNQKCQNWLKIYGNIYTG